MTRDERQDVTRRIFEIERDIVWTRDLEPKCRAVEVPDARIADVRSMWNAHAEAHDWEWFQEHLGQYSDKRLDDSLTDSVDRADALGMLEWRQAQASRGQPLEIGNERQNYQDSLASDSRRGGQEPDWDIER
jgi:hypothetical protein